MNLTEDSLFPYAAAVVLGLMFLRFTANDSDSQRRMERLGFLAAQILIVYWSFHWAMEQEQQEPFSEGYVAHSWQWDKERSSYSHPDDAHEVCGLRTEENSRPTHFYWPGKFTEEVLDLIKWYGFAFGTLLYSETREQDSIDWTYIGILAWFSYAMTKLTMGCFLSDSVTAHADFKIGLFLFVVMVIVVPLVTELLRIGAIALWCVRSVVLGRRTLSELRERSAPFVVIVGTFVILPGPVNKIASLLQLAFFTIKDKKGRPNRTRWLVRLVVLVMVYYTHSEYNVWKDRFMKGKPQLIQMPHPVECWNETTQRLDTPFQDAIDANATLKAHVLLQGHPLDVLFITFSDYLWSRWTVQNPEMIGAFLGGPQSVGIFGFLLQSWMARKGYVKQKSDTELEEKLYNAVMATSLTGFVVFKNESINEPKDVFRVGNNAFRRIYKDPKGHPNIEYGTLSCDITFKSTGVNGRIHSCWFKGIGKPEDGGGNLLTVSPSDALACAAGIVTGTVHPEIHGYTNYMLYTEDENPFLRRMALITVKFNQMGETGNPPTMAMFLKMGILHYSTEAITRAFVAPLPIPKYQEFINTRIPKLAEHKSPYADFIHKLRPVWNRLAKDKTIAKDFDGRGDPQAIFAGMFWHSLDHALATVYFDVADMFKDPNSGFEGNVEMGYLPIAAFTDNQPWRPVGDVSLKNAPILLYQKTYEHAVKLNKTMADMIEVAIAK